MPSPPKRADFDSDEAHCAAYDQYYAEQLEAGQEFQDFVVDVLHKEGLTISAYSSKKRQFSDGESRAGVEIKKDTIWRDTDRLYIEVAEKSNPRVRDFTPAGIYRNDNSWLYIIGDYSRLYVFPIRTLRRASRELRNGDPRYERYIGQTGKAFYLPLADAERLAAKIIELNPNHEEPQ